MAVAILYALTLVVALFYGTNALPTHRPLVRTMKERRPESRTSKPVPLFADIPQRIRGSFPVPDFDDSLLQGTQGITQLLLRAGGKTEDQYCMVVEGTTEPSQSLANGQQVIMQEVQGYLPTGGVIVVSSDGADGLSPGTYCCPGDLPAPLDEIDSLGCQPVPDGSWSRLLIADVFESADIEKASQQIAQVAHMSDSDTLLLVDDRVRPMVLARLGGKEAAKRVSRLFNLGNVFQSVTNSVIQVGKDIGNAVAPHVQRAAETVHSVASQAADHVNDAVNHVADHVNDAVNHAHDAVNSVVNGGGAQSTIGSGESLSCDLEEDGKNAVSGKADGGASSYSTTPTAADCREECAEDSTCMIWVWHKPDAGGWAERCVMWTLQKAVSKGRLPPSTWPDGNNHITGRCHWPCDLQEEGKNAASGKADGGPSSYVSTSSAAECEDECAEDSTCAIWVWHKPSAGSWSEKCVMWTEDEASNNGRLEPSTWPFGGSHVTGRCHFE